MTTTPWLIAFAFALSPPHSTMLPVELPANAVAHLGINPHRVGTALVAITDDSKQIVTVTTRGWLRIFEAQSGRPVVARQLFPFVQTQQTRVQHLSGNGRVVVYHDCTERRKLVVLDVVTGKELLTYPKDETLEPSPILSSATLSYDGQILLVQDFSQDSTHYLISVADGTRRKITVAECDGSYSYQFSPNGRWLLVNRHSRGVDSSWQLFDVAAGKPVDYDIHPMPQTFTPDSETLVGYDSVESGVKYSVATGKTLGRFEFDSTPTGKLLAGPNGLLVCSPIWLLQGRFAAAPMPSGLTVQVLNTNTGAELLKLPVGDMCTEPHRSEFNTTVLARDGSFLVTNTEGNLCLWELPSGRRRFGMPMTPGGRGAITQLAYSPDGTRLYCAGTRDSYGVWNIASGVWQPQKVTGEVRAIGTNALGSRAIVAANNRTMPNVWDPELGRVVTTMTSRAAVGGRGSYQRYAALNEDNTLAIVSYSISTRGERANFVDTWDVTKNARKASFSFPNDYNSVSAFSPTLELLLARDQILHTGSGRVHFELQSDASARRSTTGGRFSPDGRLLFRAFSVNSEANEICAEFWEISTGQLINTTRQTTQGVAFSPDGRTVALTKESGIVLYDLILGQPWFEYDSDDHVLDTSQGMMLHTPMAFSPDGRTLACGQRDGTVLLWKVPPPPRGAEPTPEEFDELWTQLAHRNALIARTALHRLIQHPKAGVALLRAKFLPPRPDPNDPDAKKLIADLDSPMFVTRQAAYKTLQAMGSLAHPELRAALKTTESVEVRSRVEELLDTLRPTLQLPTPGDESRKYRAMEALERMGTPEARKLLEEWAKQTRDFPMTQEAMRALGRVPQK